MNQFVSINLLPDNFRIVSGKNSLHTRGMWYKLWNKRNKRFLIKPENIVAKSLRVGSILLLVTAVGLSLITYLPKAWTYYREKVDTAIIQVLTKPTKSFGDNLVSTGDKEKVEIYQPAPDSTLSLTNRVIIKEIGIDTEIIESPVEYVDEALRKGVWRVSEFGTPYARKRPTILAAHRFGYLEWTNDFRRRSSFYNLPKLTEGDTVEIIWNQRRYLYEIYGESEGEEITDYQADLVLYTCKFLDSGVRIFRYARLIEV